MSFYKVEQWTVKELAKAFKEKSNSQRRVEIPIFQRGLRWDKDRRSKFIESIKNGYPFGSLLFATTNDINVYSVVDGLQRGSTICDYVDKPLCNIDNIDQCVLNNIRLILFPNNENLQINDHINDSIVSCFKEICDFDNVNTFNIAQKIFSIFPENFDLDKVEILGKINDVLNDYIRTMKTEYNDICSANVPIIVYTGPKDKLCEIFERINKQGIKLSDYEIYSAVWDTQKFHIRCRGVVDKVIEKYTVLLQNDYSLQDFDANDIIVSQDLSIFEYLFGLGKYWYDKYDCLKVVSKAKPDETNEIGFEIVDACLNNSKDIANLDKKLSTININKLQRCIENAINFVDDSIAVISSFKGNTRKFKVLHSKYQIISMIVNTFREMYDVEQLDSHKPTWCNFNRQYRKLLVSHYVADIIGNYWHDGGGGKLFSSIREHRYVEEISYNRWESMLDNYYQTGLANKQIDKFSNPTNSDTVILNCIYQNLFSANDQLSTKKFDIEHLATKEQMKEIIKSIGNVSLPVSCLANYCYLPEDINRGKRDKTIYEFNDATYPIERIEEKFSFTIKEDLDWISGEYNAETKELLATKYYNYLDKRYSKLKQMFLNVVCSD